MSVRRQEEEASVCAGRDHICYNVIKDGRSATLIFKDDKRCDNTHDSAGYQTGGRRCQQECRQQVLVNNYETCKHSQEERTVISNEC